MTVRPSTWTGSSSISTCTSARDHPVSSATARSTRSPASAAGTTRDSLMAPDREPHTGYSRACLVVSRNAAMIRRMAPIVMHESATLKLGNEPTWT